MSGVPAVNEDDLTFDAAFAQASGETPVTTESPKGDEPSKEEPGKPEEPAKPEEPIKPAEPVKPVEPAAPTEPVKPAEPAKEDPAVAELRNQLAAMQAELAAARQPKPEPKKPAEPEKPATPAVTAEETKALEDLKADWPNLDMALDVKLRQFQETIRTELQKQLKDGLQPLAPVVATVAETQQEKFLAAVKEKHPDINAIFPKVEAWANAQPAALKAAYNAILDKCTAEEMIGLLNTYKAATGTVTPAVDPAATAAAIAAEAEKARKLAQMEGAKKARTAVSAEIDPNDFDSAFELAARTLDSK